MASQMAADKRQPKGPVDCLRDNSERALRGRRQNHSHGRRSRGTRTGTHTGHPLESARHQGRAFARTVRQRRLSVTMRTRARRSIDLPARGPSPGNPARPARRGRRRDTATRTRSVSGSTTDRPRAGRTASSTAARALAAWRLRALGLEPGDRLLTWSPSTPELPAAYFGAMRAGLILVPLDLRMSHRRDRGHRPDLRRHAPRSSAPAATRPIPREAGLDRFPTTAVEALTADPDDVLPARLGGAGRRPGPPRPRRPLRAGLHLGHDRDAEGRDARPRQRRRLDRDVPPDRAADGAPARLAPAAVAPARAGGRAVLRAVGRCRHPVRPEPQPAGHLRCAARPPGDLDGRRPAGPRPVLERHRARGRQARPRDRVRPAFAASPATCRWASGRASSGASTSSSAATSGCSCRPGRSCRRRSSRAGRTSASPSSRATARPRRAPAAAPASTTTGSGPSGGRPRASRCASPTTARSSSRARPSSAATGRTRRRPPRPSPPTAGTGPATSATSTTRGRLILSGRIKDIIVLPNGFNVYPEDIENALRIAGIRDSVVVETQPGRIEAVVLGSAAGAPGAVEATEPAALRAAHRCRGQGRQRDARPEPADRRLAAVARGGLPADAHAQDQARPGPGLGRRGHAPARRLTARRPRAPQLATGNPTPSVSSAGWIPGAESSVDPPAASRRRRPSSRPGG